MKSRFLSLKVLVFGSCLGTIAATFWWNPSPAMTTHTQTADDSPDLKSLQAEIERLKGSFTGTQHFVDWPGLRL